MGLYDRPSLTAGTSAASKDYRDARYKHYKADTAPMKAEAADQLAQEISGKGFLPGSGIAARKRGQQRQGFLEDEAKFRQGLGMEQAEGMEADRRVLEGRTHFLEDRAAQEAWEAELKQMIEEEEREARRAQAMAALWSKVGQLGGSMIGGMMGGGGAGTPSATSSGGVTTISAPSGGWDAYLGG